MKFGVLKKDEQTGNVLAFDVFNREFWVVSDDICASHPELFVDVWWVHKEPYSVLSHVKEPTTKAFTKIENYDIQGSVKEFQLIFTNYPVVWNGVHYTFRCEYFEGTLYVRSDYTTSWRNYEKDDFAEES